MEDMNLRFIQVRKSLSLTQKGIGDALGLSNSGISNIEDTLGDLIPSHYQVSVSDILSIEIYPIQNVEKVL